MTLPEGNDHATMEKEISELVKNLTTNSPFFESNPPRPLPCYTTLETGVILGEGEFGTVREVTGFPNGYNSIEAFSQKTLATYATDETDFNDDTCSLDEENEQLDPEPSIARKIDLGQRCWRNGMARYAVKSLREDLEDKDHVQVGLADLVMEARFLASLSHPNIVKIRGTVGVPGRRNFTLILDRLYMTLSEKLSLWKTEQLRIRANCLFGLRKRKFQNNCRKFMIERLIAAYDVARVFKYLHEQKMIYRDLKPENIGYDIRGDLRLFDFGLAKEVNQDHLIRLPEDYNCTGLIGSRRWMAPEVYLCLPYGPSADVYSFGLFIWNIFSLKTPFGKISTQKHYNDVIVNNRRPASLQFLPKSLDVMMSCCWSAKREERPSFRIICSILMCELKNEQTIDLNNEILDRTSHLEAKSLCSAEQ